MFVHVASTTIITTIVDSQYYEQYEQSQSNTGTTRPFFLSTLFPYSSPAIETQNSILVDFYMYM